ncbi:MAG: alpha/beta hydrolase [Clostridia bacterium]|nr:alpha/beta hydrolase [Clostridia bacterium]
MRKNSFLIVLLILIFCLTGCSNFGKKAPVYEEISSTEKSFYYYKGELSIYGKIYLPEGDGPFPVVVLRGGMSEPMTHTERLVSTITSNGIAAVVFDPIGAVSPSKSSGELTDMSVLTEAEDLNIVIDNVIKLNEIDKENIFLWGHSLGGLVSTYVAETRSDIKGLIVVEPSYMMRDMAMEMYSDVSKIPDVVYSPSYLGGIFFKDVINLDIFEKMPEYNGQVLLIRGTEKQDGQSDEEYELGINSFDKAIKTFSSCDMYIVEGANHAFSGKYEQEMLSATIEFVKSNVG